MSLKKSATRRLSLLAGSSVFAASLSAMGGVALTPTVAHAYDQCAPTPASGTLTDGANGISDPTLNDPGGVTRNADSFTCTGPQASSGVAYTSHGNLTVLRANNTALSVGGTGIDLTAVGSDSINWGYAGTTTTNGGGVTGVIGVTGALINVTSQAGDITIVNKQVGAVQAGMTHAIRAVSTGGGDIAISKVAQSTNNNVVGGIAAIEAVTNGGNISISDGTVQGYEKGIFAQTEGAGSVTINTAAVSASTVGGVAAVDVKAGTGGISMTFGGNVIGGAGLAIRAVATGNVTVATTGQVASIRGAMDYSGVTGGGVTLTLSSGWHATGATVFSGGNDVVTSSDQVTMTLADGGSISFGAGDDTWNQTDNADTGVATIDFGTGADRLNVGGTFNATGTTLAFGAGADRVDVTGRLTLDAASAFDLGADADRLDVSGVLVAAGSLEFGAGADVMDVSGLMTVDGALALANLEAFNNSGAIFMGGQGGASTNRVVGDVLTMASGVFTGSGDSRIVMDVSFAGAAQSDCLVTEAADCVDFTGASTAGTTLLTIVNTDGTTISGSASRTTLIVGSSAADDFALDPDSDGYVLTDQGGAVRFRLFDMFLLYDADAQAHSLAAVPHVEAFQGTSFGSAAQDIWRATAGSWFDRQADLRSTPGGLEPSRGLWARGGVSVTNRDAVVPLTLLGSSFDQDVSYRQRTSHAVFGADFMGGVSGDSVWVVGASAGLVRSDSEFDRSSSEVIYAGFSGGLYASLLSGPWFIDASVNTNVLDAEIDMPSLQLDDDVAMKQKQTSVGAQLQSGWRFTMGQSVFVEPLVSVAYVQTRLDDIEVPGDAGTIEYDDATSLRAGLGVRVGADTELLGQAAGFSLTARHWNEFEGENGVSLAGNAPVLLVDDYSGAISELVAGFSMQSSSGGASTFLNLGSKFGEGYRSVDGAIGVRLRW